MRVQSKNPSALRAHGLKEPCAVQPAAVIDTDLSFTGGYEPTIEVDNWRHESALAASTRGTGRRLGSARCASPATPVQCSARSKAAAFAWISSNSWSAALSAVIAP